MDRSEIVALRRNMKARIQGSWARSQKKQPKPDSPRPVKTMLPDRLPQSLSGFEPGGLGGPDLDLFASPGVSAGPGLALSHRESAETWKSYSPSSFQLLGNGVCETVTAFAAATLVILASLATFAMSSALVMVCPP